MTQQGPIPVIDLFAGPGGLGEGFTSLVDGNGQRRFSIKVAIEKDPVAHKTLSLRAFFRQFKPGAVPECYYEYVRGKITRQELFAHSDAVEAAERATSEARCAEMGKSPQETKKIDKWIEDALGGVGYEVRQKMACCTCFLLTMGNLTLSVWTLSIHGQRKGSERKSRCAQRSPPFW